MRTKILFDTISQTSYFRDQKNTTNKFIFEIIFLHNHHLLFTRFLIFPPDKKLPSYLLPHLNPHSKYFPIYKASN